MSHLPIWAQWLQLVGTFAVAIFAAIIAYRQWVTAHQRIILDLFERRMSIFDDARKTLGAVLRTGNAPEEQISEFFGIVERVRVLFGDEVVAYAVKTRQAVTDLHLSRAMLQDKSLNQNERAHHAQQAGESMQAVVEFFTEFPRLMLPYVRMTQRMR